jgi:radical SAM superfamily enzyme YgiQ (UPF0313 family)
VSGGRLELRLGSVCSNACSHCVLGEVAALPERTTAEALDFLRHGRSLGHDELVLLHGDPLLRPDLDEIVGAARAAGYLQVVIQTNGRHLDPPRVAALRAAGATAVELSLLGPDADNHDAVAGVAGAFVETIRGLRAALAGGLTVDVAVPVTAATVARAADTVALAARLGVPRIRVEVVRPTEGTAHLVAPLDAAVAQARAAVLLGRRLGVTVTVDALPRCLLGGVADALRCDDGAPVTVVDVHRGATDAATLQRIYRPLREVCEGCGEADACPRPWHAYVEEIGGDRNLQPFPETAEPEADLCLLHPPWVLPAEPIPRQWDLLALVPSAAPDHLEALAAGEFAEKPVGLESIRRYLEARWAGRVRVVNLAGIYAGAPDGHARVARHLAALRARVFAVDLHWLVHAHGALELLRLCRQLHPAARTVVGGLSATHFAQEILRHHGYVDFVVAGDGERPMLRLLEVLTGGGDLAQVPNLWYRRHGRVVRSRGSYFAEEESDYRHLPYVPVRRGCPYDCVHCGVGQTATHAIFGARARYRYAPEKVANELLGHQGPGAHVRLVGDPVLTYGPGGMRRLLAAIGGRGGDVELGVEFQAMHGAAEIDRLAKRFRAVRLSLRPDSGDEGVRRGQGKPYSNDDLLRCVAARHDNVTVSVIFTLGLAGDDETTLARSIDLARHLLDLEARRPVEVHFQELWCLQPGSRALAAPEAHGYRAEYSDLERFRRGFLAPLLPGLLHFAPGGLDRRRYGELIRRKHAAMNRLLVESGRRPPEVGRQVTAYLETLAELDDRYERHGPGGCDASPAVARELGTALRDAFLERLGAAACPLPGEASPDTR